MLKWYGCRKLGEPEKAESFLSDLLKMYHQEGWESLIDHTYLDMAKCQQLLNNDNKYPYQTWWLFRLSFIYI